VFVALHGGAAQAGDARFRQWLAGWQEETGQRLEL
jgi:hypothetical protein